MTRAVVFAYHNVGVRCLATLLAHNIEVALVISHEDNADENIWFESVAKLAALNNIPLITPNDPNTPEVIALIDDLAPDFLFSFYYRNMLSAEILQLPALGALNMHGSLLPKYRGRVPVNWAIIHGEPEAGASLHYMEVKPDAGDLVDQLAVPILPNDTATQVFDKLTVAAEIVLNRSLPALLSGQAPRTPLDLDRGSYFGGRRPEDGRIDWTQGAWPIHNLIRAVAPPYPGAFTERLGNRLLIKGSFFNQESARYQGPCLYREDDTIYADCADGLRIRLLELELDGQTITTEEFTEIFGPEPVFIGESE
jgi:methionyl-tRNA formyltransferase